MINVNYGNVITEIQMGETEIEYVSNLIKEMPIDGKMVEWGSGGSTCKWLEVKKPTQVLYSIEHNPSWHSRVVRAIKNHYGSVENFNFLHIAEQYGTNHGYGVPIEEHPMGTDMYVNPNSIWDADIFLIDGIARAACAMAVLLKHTKENPVVMIHDYVGREAWYDWATQFFKKKEIVGPTLARFYINE